MKTPLSQVLMLIKCNYKVKFKTSGSKDTSGEPSWPFFTDTQSPRSSGLTGNVTSLRKKATVIAGK